MDALILTVQGTVTKDSELKKTVNGDEYMLFYIACHRYGFSNEDTYFIKVYVFEERLIKSLKKRVKKGRHLTVVGEFRVKKWHKRNGEEEDTLTVKASEINYDSYRLSYKKENNDKNDAQQKEE